MPELSIILPVFNEAENIPNVVEKYAKLAKKTELELIFVEDSGSEDKTREVITKLAKKNKFIKPLFTNERGYGASVFNGLKYAKGEYLCWTHSDLQTPPEDTLKALTLAKNNPGKVFVKGRRYGRPLADKLVNTLGMSIFETLILGKFLYDINAQPNLFHKSFLFLLKNPPKDFAFDLYAYYIARKNNYKIIRFPVFFSQRVHGKSAWNTGWKSRIKFIKRTIKFSFEMKKSLKN